MDAKVRRNPYIIGRPITEQEKFFGRESVFRFLDDNLEQDVKVILLHGQRRIGKSSVLSQIPNFVVKSGFKFVPFDLQDKSQLSLSGILHNLATVIIDYLNLDLNRVQLPTVEELEAEPDTFYHNFLPAVYQELRGKNLVLLLDEFDVLSDDNPKPADKHFFPYLKSLVSEQEKFFVILAIGRKLDDLSNLLELFKGVPNHEIGLLDNLSARRLISNPARDLLEYEPGAIPAILGMSAGHPYFTQVICFALFGQARERENWKVTGEDVQNVLEKAIEHAEGGLVWFWDGLPIPEQAIFSAVAEAQRRGRERNELVPQNPLTLLKEYGVVLTKELEQALKQLIEKGFLDDAGRKVKVELVRRWLLKRHSLRQEIFALEKLNPEADSIYKIAATLRQKEKKPQALKLYEQALELNPNHFSALLDLAEGYLDNKDFDKAVVVYTRGYKIDPILTQQGFVQSLLSYGNELWSKQKQEKWELAKAQFTKVREIEPDNAPAQEKLLEIQAFENQKNRHSENNWRFLSRTLIVAAVMGPVLIGIGFLLGLKYCPLSQTRVNEICKPIAKPPPTLPPPPFPIPVWEPQRFSRGERTLFPSKNNPDRNLGIEAFKQGNYPEAAELFLKAVTANRNDPEVLIYYNNAKARKKGNPLTLEVVVPVDNNQTNAEEMLRGVAQAQNQFNNLGGVDDRLLEIVIANDGNEKDKAQKVAQELIKDPSVLGVIGHNASSASSAGLAEYEKASLPMISPTSTSTSLIGNTFFRTVPSDAAAGKKLAEYSRNRLGLEKVVIFYNHQSYYSTSLKDAFAENFIRLGGQVVKKYDLSNQNLNIKEVVLDDLFVKNVDAALLFPSAADTDVALKIAKTYTEKIANSPNQEGRELKLLGGDALYSDTTLKKGGEAVEGLILAVPWFREAPNAKDFSEQAKTQWGGSVSWRTATSFDATQAFISTLNNNPSRQDVLKRLSNVNLSPTETSGDALQFTIDGERESEPILVEVVGGNFRLLR